MSADLSYRHHEEPRLSIYDSDDDTLPIPLKYVDVMRQTQKSTNDVSENTFSDFRTEANVTLSEEWTGTTRF